MKTIMTAGKGGTGKSIMLANLLTQHILLQPNSSRAKAEQAKASCSPTC